MTNLDPFFTQANDEARAAVKTQAASSPFNKGKARLPRTISDAQIETWYAFGGVTVQHVSLQNSKKVRCIYTGKIYPSARAAADSINKKADAVSMAIRRQRDRGKGDAMAGGLRWEYVK